MGSDARKSAFARTLAVTAPAGIALAGIALATVLAMPTAAQPAGRSDPIAGRALALKVCTACHVVSPDQPFPPIRYEPAPPFQAIANRPDTGMGTLTTFLRTTHTTVEQPFTMPNLLLTDRQVMDLSAYILSLRATR